MGSIASIAFTPRQLASIAALGFFTVMMTGIAGCIALIFTVIWGVMQLALLILQSTVLTLSTIETTFTTANPTVRLLVLVLISYCVYHVYRKIAERIARYGRA